MDSQETTDGTSFSALSIEDRIRVLAVLIVETLALRAREEAKAAKEFED